MRIGSLCTGYGGLDLATESVMDAETVWYAEFDKHVAKIMEQHRPELNNLWDLTKVDWLMVEPVDILTAGYPCQPFSAAGQRKGTNDSRHIWPSIAKAISSLRPGLVVLENVRGHLTLGFDEVIATLSQIGYDSKWEIVRASDVGAPHQRARLFVVAYPKGTRWGSQQDRQATSTGSSGNGLGSINKPDFGSITNTKSGWSGLQQVGNKKKIPEFRNNLDAITNTNSDAHKESRRTDRSLRIETGQIIDRTNREVHWGRYQDAIARWERLTRQAPTPVTDDRLEPKFVEWMMGLPDGWVTETSLNRNQQLKALGNGVVPQQAAYALELLLNKN